MTTSPRLRLLYVMLLAACEGGEDASRVVDAWIASDAPSCLGVTSCNLLSQAGCCENHTCKWVRVSAGPTEPEQLGQIGCLPTGTAMLDEACTWGPSGSRTGFDNCADGLICVANPAVEEATGTCRPICSLYDATLPCSLGLGCTAVPKYFVNNSMDDPLAGICESTCNPLTQVRDSDGAPACGSASPNMPDRGCYGFPSSISAPTDFTCYHAGTLGHREIATPPIRMNSCLPGAIPMLRESSGSMQVVCIAPCAPLRINYNEPVDAYDGAEPHSCPEMPLAVGVVGPVARADGPNERCQHLWWWEDASTPLTAASNAYGFCIDPTRYTHDHDNMPATPPAPWPMPETLTPYELPMDPAATNTDLMWGYAPYPMTLTGNAPTIRRAADLGFLPFAP